MGRGGFHGYWKFRYIALRQWSLQGVWGAIVALHSFGLLKNGFTDERNKVFPISFRKLHSPFAYISFSRFIFHFRESPTLGYFAILLAHFGVILSCSTGKERMSEGFLGKRHDGKCKSRRERVTERASRRWEREALINHLPGWGLF